MKAFTTLAFAASLAITGAQVTFNETTGVYTCAMENAAYCAGASLSTNIIIRCNGFIGQPGNCNDNLDGEFPVGLNYAPCYQISPTSGEAACSKNCIVYGGSGTINGTFSIPGCVPSTTSSSSATSIPLTTASISCTSVPVSVSVNTTSSLPTPPTPPHANTTSTQPTPPPPSSSGTAPISSGTAPTVPTSTSNSTIIVTSATSTGSATATPVGPTTSLSATATPVGPTKTGPSTFPGAAASNKAGAFLAAAGFLVAFLF